MDPRPPRHWLFGYGSLIWRPDFPFLERQPAVLHGWTRRFWQGSHDHRGLPHAPGRVVTLIEAAGARCLGMAYALDGTVYDEVVAALDVREKNGYARFAAPVYLHGGADAAKKGMAEGMAGGSTVEALVYIATPDNHAFLGPAPLESLAQQIHRSHGPSGSNREYLFELAAALRALDARHQDDAHVYELDAAVRALS